MRGKKESYKQKEENFQKSNKISQHVEPNTQKLS